MPSYLRVRERLGLRPTCSFAKSTTQPPLPSQPPGLPPQSPVRAQSSASAPSTAITASRNRALDKAVEEHLRLLPQSAKDAFSQAFKHIDPKTLLASVKDYVDAHRDSSRFRPQAERLSKFLGLLNRFTGGITIAIQASPDISS